MNGWADANQRTSYVEISYRLWGSSRRMLLWTQLMVPQTFCQQRFWRNVGRSVGEGTSRPIVFFIFFQIENKKEKTIMAERVHFPTICSLFLRPFGQEERNKLLTRRSQLSSWYLFRRKEKISWKKKVNVWLGSAIGVYLSLFSFFLSFGRRENKRNKM